MAGLEPGGQVLGLVGIDGISTALTALRMSIKIGADGVPEEELRALAESAEAQSPVSCTLRECESIALDVSVVSHYYGPAYCSQSGRLPT